jgi:hypothetical protein
MLGVTPGPAAVRFATWVQSACDATQDEKSNVRRAALQAVEAATVARRSLRAEDCALVVAASSDALLSVRRQVKEAGRGASSLVTAQVSAGS